MLYRGYRVRATRRRGKSKALVLLSCALPDTPASREQRPRFTCPEKRRENHTSCLRVRSVSAQGAAVWTGKKRQTIWHVCAALRPAVQKKYKDSELPEKDW